VTEAEIEAVLPTFEGLVKTTAAQIEAGGVELDFDDIAQLVRIKVWHAVCKFNAERAADSKHLSRARDRHGRSPLQRYVFTCVANLRKDIEKRPRRYNSSIDEIRGQSAFGVVADWFDLRYLSVEHEQVFWEVEDEPPALPATLTTQERLVVELRCNGRLFTEIDRELGLSRAQREEVVRSVREKLADWRPSDAPERVPMRPLPGVEPRSARARVPLAA
jgi:DNA-directed RNA polymerase specialized sigma24 family protein